MMHTPAHKETFEQKLQASEARCAYYRAAMVEEFARRHELLAEINDLKDQIAHLVRDNH